MRNFDTMKQVIFYLLALSLNQLSAQSRVDSIDVTQYTIRLKINQSSKTIAGLTELTVKSKVTSLQDINLDLLKLSVDSIKINNLSVPFQYNDTVLRVRNSTPILKYDSVKIAVYYHGTPVSDATWGGFYFIGQYAFNLGVGFDANPNSFGRVWFPCLDDFRSRSTFDYYITTDTINKVFCNGLLQGTQVNGSNERTWHWKETHLIPVYLSSVAIAPYTSITRTLQSRLSGKSIPVILNALVTDTAKLRSSFKNLDSALYIFEEVFGPYPFDKIGYNVVPFGGGAMEHTGNIAYPLFAVDGTLAYETMMAHELSHSWFGGLYNSGTSADMWLNEGWASYCESLFTEYVYGTASFKKSVRANHKYVLQFAHLKEGGYLPVSGVPHAYTYGTHSYKKGADVAHTFRNLCPQYSANSVQALKNMFVNNTLLPVYGYWESDDKYFNCGGINQRNSWMKSPGFPHLKIKAFEVTTPIPNKFHLNVYLDRWAVGTKDAVGFVKDTSLIYLTAFGINWERYDFTLTALPFMSYPVAEALLPFRPVYLSLDFDERISDAITDKYVVMHANDSVDFEEALMRIKATTFSDSALVRVEHHWFPADQLNCKIPGLYVSNYRFWTVDGLWPTDFKATAYITYDGRQPSQLGNIGYLDHTFIRKTEDSLALVYRPVGETNWQLYSDIVKTTGTKTDKYGTIRINNLKKGDYALAMYDFSLGTINKLQAPNQLRIFPNPVSETIQVIIPSAVSADKLTLVDITGKTMYQTLFKNTEKQFSIQVNKLPKGMYLIIVQTTDGNMFSRFLKE